jgi:hypothetical protein
MLSDENRDTPEANINRRSAPSLYESIFKKQQWHRPYADALMEGDTAKIPSAVSCAEQAIFARFVELNATAENGEETADLRKAIDALSDLKKDLAEAGSSVRG